MIKKVDGYAVAEITSLITESCAGAYARLITKEEIEGIKLVSKEALPALEEFFKAHLNIEELEERLDNERSRGDINYNNFCREENLKEKLRDEKEDITIALNSALNEINGLREEVDAVKINSTKIHTQLMRAEESEKKLLSDHDKAQANLELAVDANNKLHTDLVKKDTQVDSLISIVNKCLSGA